jgi:hypothetical protein
MPTRDLRFARRTETANLLGDGGGFGFVLFENF